MPETAGHARGQHNEQTKQHKPRQEKKPASSGSGGI